MGTDVDVYGLSPVPPGDVFIDLVEDFQYMGSCICRYGEMRREISECLAKAARMFGCLHSSIIVNKNLSIDIKRYVYIVTVLPILLYGADTWSVKAIQTRYFQNFINHFIRCILGVSLQVQWREYITTKQLALRFGMTKGQVC